MRNSHGSILRISFAGIFLGSLFLGGCNQSVQTPVQAEFNAMGEFVPGVADGSTPTPASLPASPPNSIAPAEIPGHQVTLVAHSGMSTDVRTTTDYLTGAPTPPTTTELQALGEQILAALDSGDDVWLAQLADSEPAPGGALPIPQSEAPIVAEENFEPEGTYVLGAGDSFDVTVFDMPEFGRALTIRPDGYISFPLIREIKAAGKTPAELEDAFEERLAEHIFSPQVSIVVTSVASKAYYVFGAVQRTGPTQLFRDTTLLQAILTAGGPMSQQEANGGPVPLADMSRIRVIRNRGNTREIITKNLSGMSAQEMLLYEDIPIQPDDIIYVPSKESQIVYVFGAVPQPGIIPVRQNTPILEALLSVGGPIPGAKTEQILVIRPQGNGARYWCVNLDAIEQGQLSQNIILQGGDIIYVPQKFIAKVGEFVQLFASAAGPFMSTYLTAWDAWWVHERYGALRRNDYGIRSFNTLDDIANPDF